MANYQMVQSRILLRASKADTLTWLTKPMGPVPLQKLNQAGKATNLLLQ